MSDNFDKDGGLSANRLEAIRAVTGQAVMDEPGSDVALPVGEVYALVTELSARRLGRAAEPQAVMGEQALEEHRVRLQALMKEAIAPLLERIDAAEEDAKVYRQEVVELETRLQAERIARSDAHEAKVDKRFRASLAAEIRGKGNVNSDTSMALDLADDILKAVGL